MTVIMNTEPSLKDRQLKVLQETVDYYSADPLNRRSTAFVDGETICRYNPPNPKLSDGCAVGRLVDPDLRPRLDGHDGTSQTVGEIFDQLPKDVRSLGRRFLAELQIIHDCDENWDKGGLSDQGRRAVDKLKTNIRLGAYEL